MKKSGLKNKETRNSKWIENNSPSFSCPHPKREMIEFPRLKLSKPELYFPIPLCHAGHERTFGIKSMNRCWSFSLSVFDRHSCLFSLDYILRTFVEILKRRWRRREGAVNGFLKRYVWKRDIGIFRKNVMNTSWSEIFFPLSDGAIKY